MSNYPDDFRGTDMDESEPVDNRNEDDVRESREEAKEHYNGVAVETTPMERAIFECFKPGANIHDQLRALNELTAKSL